MDYKTKTDLVANTYARFPVTIVSGRGARVTDSTGKVYLDLTSGIAVCNLGHCHPDVVAAVRAQADRLFHISNLYWTEPQLDVARLLVENSCLDQVFFCNSGAESVEAAIKLARKFGHDTKGPDCFEIVCLKGSFHGRTLAAISATGQPVYQRGFEPLPAGFTHVPPNDIEALRMAVTRRTCAILMEPILGEGGVRPLSDDFLLEARRLCDERGLLLMFDEVQVGMGRTGTLFAYEQTPVEPDVVCLAKGLGNGLPIGAMLARRGAMEHLTPGTHASTFGGNPVACAGAKAVLENLLQTDILDRVRRMGEHVASELRTRAELYPGLIADVRGRGLIQAIEFKRPLPGLANWLLDHGVLVIVAGGKILRLLPPFVVEQADIDEFFTLLDQYLQQAAKQ